MTIRRRSSKSWKRAGIATAVIAVLLCPAVLAFSRFYNVDCQDDGYPVIYLEWPPNLAGGGAVEGGMYVNPNCEDPGCPASSEIDAVTRAMQTWNEAPFHFTFEYQGETTALPYDGSYDPDLSDEVSVVGWNSIDGPGNILGRAWVFFECWGEILETDIEFDTSEDWDSGGDLPPDEWDLESIALHELGHCLGLDHSMPPAVMYGEFSPGIKRLELTQDDIDGGLAVYGPEPSAVEGFEQFK